jgi:hypothetical protein
MLKNCEIRIAKLMYNTEQDYKDFLTETNKQAAEATVTTGQAEQSGSGKTLEETGYFWENTPNYAEEAFAAQEIQPGDNRMNFLKEDLKPSRLILLDSSNVIQTAAPYTFRCYDSYPDG